jgi:hypothetical protein
MSVKTERPAPPQQQQRSLLDIPMAAISSFFAGTLYGIWLWLSGSSTITGCGRAAHAATAGVSGRS